MLDAVERIMLVDGYAAVTSRRVEAESGLKLHYHFGTLDDLFVAVVRRRGESNVALLADALDAAEPLRAWWKLLSEPAWQRVARRAHGCCEPPAALQAELAAFAREVRRMQIDALESLLVEYGIDSDLFPPALVAPTLQGLAFSMAHDKAAGFDTPQADASSAMDRLVDRLERARASRREA